MPPAKKPTRSRCAPNEREVQATGRAQAAHDVAGRCPGRAGGAAQGHWTDVAQGARDLYRDLRTFVSIARPYTGKLAKALQRDFGHAPKRVAAPPRHRLARPQPRVVSDSSQRQPGATGPVEQSSPADCDAGLRAPTRYPDDRALSRDPAAGSVESPRRAGQEACHQPPTRRRLRPESWWSPGCRRTARRQRRRRSMLPHHRSARSRTRGPASDSSSSLPASPVAPAKRGFRASAVGSGVPAGSGAASAPPTALSGAREVADEMPVQQRTQVCIGRRERGCSTPICSSATSPSRVAASDSLCQP